MTATPELEIDRQDWFHRWEWRVQRWGRWLWLALIIAGLLGLFGSGWISWSKRSSADGKVTLSYQRFVRHHCPGTLTVSIQPDADETEQTLIVENQFLDQVQVERTRPRTAREELQEDGTVWTFSHSRQTEPVVIELEIMPDGYGDARGKLQVIGHEPIEFRQFIFP